MKALVAHFRAINRWDVKHLTQLDWAWPVDKMSLFKDIAVRRVEPVNKLQQLAAPPQLASIHFDGSITRRGTEGKELKGNLFFAYPGDLVFSKIDIRNGAIGVVPQELGTVAFTSEYPIYNVEIKGQFRANFVKLLCQTKIFKSKINALVVGHSGRKRVAPDLLENLSIPIPALDDQDQILNQYQDLIDQAKAADIKAEQFERLISKKVLEHLAIQTQEFQRIRHPFVFHFKNLDRWALTNAMLAIRGISEDVRSEYPMRSIGDPKLSTVSSGITKSPANRPAEHARPYLRVANVQDTRLDLTVMKMIDVSDDQMPFYRLEDGDLLLCEGNSEELVGRPAIWHNEIVDCVHQNHIIKVRVNCELLNPEYVLSYMNTPPARLYFLGRAKRTTNLASINITDVRELPIPVPPMPVQEAIIHDVTLLRTQVGKYRTESSQLKHLAVSQLEQMILGVTPIKTNVQYSEDDRFSA